MQQLLIGSALLVIVGACSLPVDRETRAYNVCLARHAQEMAICEGPRQAFEVDASDIPARVTASRPGAGYIREGALLELVPGSNLPFSIHTDCLVDSRALGGAVTCHRTLTAR